MYEKSPTFFPNHDNDTEVVWYGQRSLSSNELFLQCNLKEIWCNAFEKVNSGNMYQYLLEYS